MKRVLWFLVLLILVSAASGQYYNKDSLEMNLKMDGSILVVPEAEDYRISKIETELYFYPKDGFQQKVLELSTNPGTTKEKRYLLYIWEGPKERELNYSLEARLRVFDNIHKVRGKIDFPSGNWPEEVQEYTEQSEIIDSNDAAISQKASELVEGEDDLYVVVHRLATWVEENIDYDLDTITADASQKASWVLENKRGVCDEMTSLFIAMCRSLGIPAKFVSGISYSNDPLFAEPWQAHGWAEIYFSGYGWVPFDVTFDEYGYVDPTHIKLHESADADEPTTKFSWLGNNVDLEVRELDLNVEILQTGEERAREVDLEIEVLENQVGFGSYNLVKAEIKNLKNYYVAKTLYLASTDEVEIVGSKKHALLNPGEKKILYWIIKLTNNLNERYTYTFPVLMRTEKNYSAKTEFVSEEGKIFFSKNEIEERLSGLEEEEEKILSKEVKVDCSLEKETVKVGEEASIRCTVRNAGNIILSNLRVCLEDDCQTASLNINEEKTFSGTIEGEDPGEHKFLVTVSNKDVRRDIDLDYEVIDASSIEIAEVNYPKVADFDEEFKISFVLKKISFAIPKNAKVILLHEGYPNEWFVERLEADKKFEIDFSGRDLGFGGNEFEIKISWEDETGNYETGKRFKIQLGETSFREKIAVFFRSINRFFGKLIK